MIEPSLSSSWVFSSLGKRRRRTSSTATTAACFFSSVSHDATDSRIASAAAPLSSGHVDAVSAVSSAAFPCSTAPGASPASPPQRSLACPVGEPVPLEMLCKATRGEACSLSVAGFLVASRIAAIFTVVGDAELSGSGAVSSARCLRGSPTGLVALRLPPAAFAIAAPWFGGPCVLSSLDTTP